MTTRREALGALMLPVLPGACTPRRQWVGPGPGAARVPPPPGSSSPEEIARNEDYWAEVARAFTIDRSSINLNNGGGSPSPAVVQQAMLRHLSMANSTPTWQALTSAVAPQREVVRQRLATHWGVDAEELAITRSTTEGLEICQLGIDLARGDEVLATTQDYPGMIATFKQRERREGIVLRQFKLPVPPAEDPARIVALYESNITPRTRLILVTHVSNYTGLVMPVPEIAAMARKRGIPVMVDGAHSLAHFDFKISDLGCDYFAASLHKWLFAPHGTGLLYVRRDKIRGLWPLMPASPKLDDNIRKFEQVGLQPAANALAVAEALTFHQAIGGARKEARLLYLRNIWTKRLLASGRVKLLSSLRPAPPRVTSSIAMIEIEGIDPAKLSTYLWDKHRIHTIGILHDEFRGLRVTPSVYTTLEELDRFCTVVEQVIRNGLPA
ncbi:MAG TPA: aminotransferase class V-fold PLP-dependent enzyme [Kofleriaceae bacterium]|nr:aminotransferase class V-fold PLP-dependent enzyme [Kofleriaceae bacterium]